MTDLDHFAAAALTGLLANMPNGAFEVSDFAGSIYDIAEAMVAERVRRLKLNQMDIFDKTEPNRK